MEKLDDSSGALVEGLRADARSRTRWRSHRRELGHDCCECCGRSVMASRSPSPNLQTRYLFTLPSSLRSTSLFSFHPRIILDLRGKSQVKTSKGLWNSLRISSRGIHSRPTPMAAVDNLRLPDHLRIDHAGTSPTNPAREPEMLALAHPRLETVQELRLSLQYRDASLRRWATQVGRSEGVCIGPWHWGTP